MRKTGTNQGTNSNRNTTMKRLPLYSFVHLNHESGLLSKVKQKRNITIMTDTICDGYYKEYNKET
jgi:hypothetical protein